MFAKPNIAVFGRTVAGLLILVEINGLLNIHLHNIELVKPPVHGQLFGDADLVLAVKDHVVLDRTEYHNLDQTFGVLFQVIAYTVRPEVGIQEFLPSNVSFKENWVKLL